MTTYGIDLGTTYSCIAYVDDAGRPVVVQNGAGADTTPSVVQIESADSVVVGQTAKDSAKLRPDEVFSLVKRQMGQTVEFEAHGGTYTPESISALILRELANSVELVGGEPVKDVVITVPAYFGVGEKEATRNAGRIAGLNVLDLLPEPVAAALHYETLSDGTDKSILVYDLGGGTFDTTVIRLEQDDVRVVCTDGDHHLGGADWDTRIADFLLQQFIAANPDSDAAQSEEFLQELTGRAEQVKKELSSSQLRKQSLSWNGAGAKVEISRDQFEQMTSELLEQTMEITQRTVDVARSKGIDRFDDVLLVGGAARMPAVKQGLQQRFGFEPKLHDPDQAVAKGAARFALIKSVKVSLPGEDPTSRPASDAAVQKVADQLGLSVSSVRELAEKKVTTVVPRAFGVKLVDVETNPSDERFYVQHVLAANTELPASTQPQEFYTVYPRQTGIELEVWEQAGAVESPELIDNSPIGKGLIDGLPPLPKGSPLHVTFDMDEVGTLTVHAVELSTRKDLTITLHIDGLDAEQVEEARGSIARMAVSG